jgi:hypothetical protein
MASPVRGTSELVLSYLGLRRAIGVIGTALPFVLAAGGLILGLRFIEASMSSYYYTGMRDIFVGALCAIAVFMASYRGYDWKDALAGDVACVSAIGVALCPTTPAADATRRDQLVGGLHYVFAAVFFLTLAVFCLWLFRKTDPGLAPTARKLQRNAIYTACGSIILACLAAIVATNLWLDPAVRERLAVLFWLEAVAVVAFGVSWLTKGESIRPDLPHA